MSEIRESEFERLLESAFIERGFRLKGVTWTANRVKLVSSRARRNNVELRIARKLLALDARTIVPIVGMVVGDRSARGVLQGLFEELPVEAVARRTPILRPQGDAVDLRGLIEAPCALLNMDPGDIQITWGARRHSRRRQRTYRLGSYNPRTDVVRLHRVLDHASVPTFYIEYVIYHELVHRHVALEQGHQAARRHDRYFRRLEASFPRFEEAIAWEREHLMRHARMRG